MSIISLYKNTLIYDESLNSWRDRTLHEHRREMNKLNIDYNCEFIFCPCLTGKITQLKWSFNSFKNHCEGKKHKNWLEKENSQLCQLIGSCPSDESKIDFLLRENKNHKKENLLLNKEIESLKKQNLKLSSIYDELQNDFEKLNIEFANHKLAYKKKSKNNDTLLKIYIQTLSNEVRELENCKLSIPYSKYSNNIIRKFKNAKKNNV